jgi:hypothetical protein
MRRRRLGRWPSGHGDARPCRSVGDDQPGGLTGPRVIPAVAGRAEDAPRVVAAPTVAAVGAEEHVMPAAAVLPGACAPLRRLGLDLPGEQLGKERREVDGQARLPVRAAIGIVFRRQPVKRAPELAQLPLDVDLVPLHKLALQADDLAQPQPGVGDRDDHGEVIVPAGQQRGPLRDQQRLQRRHPHPLRSAVQLAPGPAAAVAGPDRRIVGDQWWLGGRRVAQDRTEHCPSIPGSRRSGPGWRSPSW